MTKTLMLLAAVAAVAVPSSAVAKQRTTDGATLAIIGDTPYSNPQIANFHNDVDAINNDPDVERVVHLGDIKSGSTQCTDTYFASSARSSTASRIRSSTRRATTSGPTATGPTTAASTRSSAS